MTAKSASGGSIEKQMVFIFYDFCMKRALKLLFFSTVFNQNCF